MPYPEQLVKPMREELTRVGVRELRTADEVDAAFSEAAGGTMLLVINSVCGCAAAMARPAVVMAAQHAQVPDVAATVFAGQDIAATVRVREYLAGIPPSSPFIALFKGGDVAYLIERHHIEGRSAHAIASDLVGAYDKYCGTETSADDVPESPQAESLFHAPATFRSFR